MQDAKIIANIFVLPKNVRCICFKIIWEHI